MALQRGKSQILGLCRDSLVEAEGEAMVRVEVAAFEDHCSSLGLGFATCICSLLGP